MNKEMVIAGVNEDNAEEMKLILSAGAVWSNKFFASAAPNHVRIAFAENMGNVIVPRTAISMSRDDAESLCMLLRTVLDGGPIETAGMVKN